MVFCGGGHRRIDPESTAGRCGRRPARRPAGGRRYRRWSGAGAPTGSPPPWPASPSVPARPGRPGRRLARGAAPRRRVPHCAAPRRHRPAPARRDRPAAECRPPHLPARRASSRSTSACGFAPLERISEMRVASPGGSSLLADTLISSTPLISSGMRPAASLVPSGTSHRVSSATDACRPSISSRMRWPCSSMSSAKYCSMKVDTSLLPIDLPRLCMTDRMCSPKISALGSATRRRRAPA